MTAETIAQMTTEYRTANLAAQAASLAHHHAAVESAPYPAPEAKVNQTELDRIEARLMDAARNADTTRVALRRLRVAARKQVPGSDAEIVIMTQIHTRNMAALKDAQAALSAAMRAKTHKGE